MARKRNCFPAVFAAIALALLVFTGGAEAQVLPLFQYQVFYNLDLDLSPGGAMTFTGPVFCNSNIWCYPGGQVAFDDTVEAAESYFFHWDTNGDQSANIADPAIAPIFNDGRPISGIVPLAFPASDSTNFESLLNLPPPEVRAPQKNAYFPTNLVYFFNAAGLIISNASYGINGVVPWSNSLTVYFQDPSPPYYAPSNWVRLTNDFYIISNRYNSGSSIFSTNYVPDFQFTNNALSIRWINNPPGTNSVWYAGFSFLTNTSFYDYRESATVQVVQVDVGKLGTWITNAAPNGGGNWNQALSRDTGHPIDSIYVYNDVPFISQHQLPAVSLVNGQQLPSSFNGLTNTTFGLAVVTPQPLYLIGNYNVQITGSGPILGSHNTADTYPAALMADAITVLSTNWLSNSGKLPYTARPAVDTTINAACLCGIVPSNGGQNDGGDGSNAHYSGGLENFFRLLENWTGLTLTYNGSMTAMFPSIYATNYWQLPDNYYSPPIRNWAFDTNFLVQADLPPLTPLIVNSNAAPMILTQPQPASAVVLAGQTTNFVVSASGFPAVSYQWFLVGGTNIFGATNASLSLTDIQLASAGNYYVVVTNLLGSVTSSNALLSVYASAAPVLNAFSFSPYDGAEFSVSGVPGFNYTVEASTNLIDWVPLMTSNSPFTFDDTNANLPQRFYRSILVP